MADEKVIDLARLDRFHSNLKSNGLPMNDWQANKKYKVGYVVIYNENQYRCTVEHTSTSTFDSTKFDLVGGSGNGNGLNDWVANTQYKIDSIVVNDGQIYKSLVEFTSGSTFENIEILEDYELQTGDTPISWAEGAEINTNDIVEYNSNYYKALYNFTCGSTFTKTVFEEYVPKSLTDDDIDDIVEEFNPVQSGGVCGVPIGTIISFMGVTAPSDYLICDGTVYNITDYQALADHINTQFGSYNFFGGDGTTTFAVPDLRGEFLRGTGTNSHTNQGSGASVGVHQDGTKMPSIHMWTQSESASNGVLGGEFSNSGGTNYPSSLDYAYNAINTRYYGDVNVTKVTMSTDSTLYAYTSRPTNTSVLYCIKYK